jgi:hypothetical protein
MPERLPVFGVVAGSLDISPAETRKPCTELTRICGITHAGRIM